MVNLQLSQLPPTSSPSVVICMEEEEGWTLERANNENNALITIVHNTLTRIPELKEFQKISPSGHPYFPIENKEAIKKSH